MKALTYVEIDCDRCSRTYGVAPCTASIPTTGSRKCFNTLGTCQDRDNFDDEEVTIRFAVATDYLPPEIECIPCIESDDNIEFSPGILSIGVDLGQRANLKVKLRDHPDSDTGPHGDPYLADRDYNPYQQGTFFGKFRARRTSLRGKALRIIRGSVGQALADMERRHYIIDSHDGPDRDGVFTISAADPFKLADGDRAQAPRLSNGFLASDINSSTTSATLSPAGIGNAEYPASGYIAIGGTEICAFTRSGNTLTLTRGQLGTTGVAHSAQDRCQICLRYVSAEAAELIQEWLEDYAGVPASWITIADWLQETDSYLGNLYTGTIAEPTSVNKLVSELIEQAGLVMWPDDVAQKLRLQVMRAISTSAKTFRQSDNTVAGSVQVKEQPDQRVSQVWTYFGQINPLKEVDDVDNYRCSAVTTNADSETNFGSPAIKKIFSRWIPSGGRTLAERLNNIIIGRKKVPPRRVMLDVFRNPNDPAASLSQGEGARVEAWFIQDDTGAASNIPVQVVRVEPDSYRFKAEAEEMQFEDLGGGVLDRVVILDANENNVNFRTKCDEIFSVPESGDDVYCIVNAGVIIGSTSTSTPAFDVGTWPSGVNVFVTVNGRIQGKGGAGGKGEAKPANGVAGGAGGPALYTRQAITLDGTGQIWGGGGGGGGGGGSGGGSGGGGGQGSEPGTGGLKGISQANNGAAGTTEAPGAGGGAVPAWGAGKGGDGGAEGAAGAAGSTSGSGNPGAGGAAGRAIDGNSYVTESGSLDVQGTRVN